MTLTSGYMRKTCKFFGGLCKDGHSVKPLQNRTTGCVCDALQAKEFARQALENDLCLTETAKEQCERKIAAPKPRVRLVGGIGKRN